MKMTPDTGLLPGKRITAEHDDHHFRTPQSEGVPEKELEQLIRKSIDGEVRFDSGSRALYATDASNYRQVPIGVVIPRHKNDILQTLKACRKYQAPVLMRGGGTSLAGQCCNVAVILDTSKYYNRILEFDIEKKTIRVETGIVLDDLRKFTRKHDLTFNPDPATHSHCTIGGMLGNNSCGAHSVMSANFGDGARTSDNTLSLNVVTYGGLQLRVGATSEAEYQRIIAEGGPKADLYRKLRVFVDKYADAIRSNFPHIPRRVSGYNLPALLPENGFNIAQALVGSECTCVTILDATLKLMDRPQTRSLLVLGYPNVYEAGAAVTTIMKQNPIAVEGLDDMLIHYMHKKGLHETDLPLLPDGKGWLMVEFDGNDKNESDEKARSLMKLLKATPDAPSMRLFDDAEEEARLWEIRESGLGATAWVPGEPMSVPGWEDSAVPPEKVGDYMHDLRRLFDKYDYHPSLYGHFGQGCVHCRVQFDLLTQSGLEKYQQFTVEAAALVKEYGGSLSGEHGDGQSRGDLLSEMYSGEIMQAFHEFKSLWDPDNRMNPGKIIDTYGQLSNLRINNHYHPQPVKTHFAFSQDQFDFSHATLRCVGVGRCRQKDGGTMCPSYMVTHEEKHSTRGRARMLFEMMQGDSLPGGWKSKAVKDSLDLCLSCKGCKSECPVNVDMATYKAEFLSHYYEGRLRPRQAYTFGFIHWWARLAAHVPGLVNFVLHAPLLAPIAKWMGGISQKRQIPRFANITFREWFTDRCRNRSAKNPNGPTVILWADTFNNHFMPETLAAGVEVLEAAGFNVVTPRKSLCCGRPLYDFGMLALARKMLLNILETLRPYIQADLPIVVLEPSCAAVFRDELVELLPHDADAARLKNNVFTLAEFLLQHAPDFQVPQINGNALVHGHCHQKSVMGMQSEKKILVKTGLGFNLPDTGCCGMAGYFGYEPGAHYQISVKAADRVLIPAVNKAGKGFFIIANGFSCRSQIEQQSDRRALHLAQVLQMGVRGQDAEAEVMLPEEFYDRNNRLKKPSGRSNTLWVGAALLTGYLLARRFWRNRK